MRELMITEEYWLRACAKYVIFAHACVSGPHLFKIHTVLSTLITSEAYPQVVCWEVQPLSSLKWRSSISALEVDICTIAQSWVLMKGPVSCPLIHHRHCILPPPPSPPLSSNIIPIPCACIFYTFLVSSFVHSVSFCNGLWERGSDECTQSQINITQNKKVHVLTS